MCKDVRILILGLIHNQLVNNGYDTLTEWILSVMEDCGLGPLYLSTQLDMLGGLYFFSWVIFTSHLHAKHCEAGLAVVSETETETPFAILNTKIS